jgi:hypothetical protein
MIYLTSYLNRSLFLLLSALILSSCVGKPGFQPLVIDALELERYGPPTEKYGGINWLARTRGGQGELEYLLESQIQGIATTEQTSQISQGQWRAAKPGDYRFRVGAKDTAGKKAFSQWSKPFSFSPAVKKGSLCAVLPVENLSDSPVPLDEINNELINVLAEQGFHLVDRGQLDNYMQKARMRYVGGINEDIAQSLRKELGVEAVFITALETWTGNKQARVSLISRLVITSKQPEIVWMDSIGLTADDEIGLLGIGRVDTPQGLLVRGLDQLMVSLNRYLDGTTPLLVHAGGRKGLRLVNEWSANVDGSPSREKKRFQPHLMHRASDFDPSRKHRVAVVPFLNINTRKHAEIITTLYTVKELQRYYNVQVFEPGLIRDRLLRYRMIMQSGPSLAASDVLADEGILGADLIVSGKVFDYQDRSGESKVDFSLQVFDGPARRVVWTSRSFTSGNENVYFFDRGRIRSAHDLSGRMMRSVIRGLEE